MAGVAKMSNGTYQARWRDQERKQRSKNFTRKADAERFLDQVRGDLVRGTYLDPALNRRTLKEYAEEWRGTQPHRIGTKNLYERTLRLHVYPKLGHRPMTSILRSDVQALCHELSQHLGPKTVENVHRLLAAIFNHAIDDGLATRNPCRRVSLPEQVDRELMLLSTEQIWALSEAIPARYRALVLLAAGSGMRQGEILGLTHGCVDFLRRTAHVEKQLISVPGTPVHLGEPKTKLSVRRIPLPDFVLEALAEHVRLFPSEHPWGLVFTDTGGRHVGRSSFHKTWRRAVTAAKLPESTTFHILRHTYASILIDQNLNVVIVSKRLGHATPTETLKTYAHLFPSADDDTRSAISTAFERPAPNRCADDQTAVPQAPSRGASR